MRFFADFHIHSKYSRATSPSMDLRSLDKWAQIKGITVLGTGDFTHPLWLESIKKELTPAEPGLFCVKGASASDRKLDTHTRFLLTSEISCIYSKGGKVRKIHIIIFAPSIESVEKINKELNKIGNLKADGRPILGLDAKELTKIVFDADKDCMVIPAHAWTPWFSVFGSKSGFDSLEECFEEYTKYIYAIETGLSSDPAMNWRLSQLDSVALISNSDCHSPQKIGREANVFDTKTDYKAIIEAIKSRDKKKFLYTVEFFPEEGKYHYDGHRECKISLGPEESKKYNNTCPRCGKPLVIGVLNRVVELADRAEGFVPKGAVTFKSLIPLQEVIAEALGTTVLSKEVTRYYNNLIENIGPEFKILLDVSGKEIKNSSSDRIAEAVIKMREGKVSIEPGYDGVYGKIKIFPVDGKAKSVSQKTLF